MIDWLLDIGKRYLNKERVAFVCKGMLYLLFVPVLLLLFGVFGTKWSNDFSIIGQISDLLFDLCMATVCLSIMTLAYADGNKLPVIGYFVVITVIKGVYQFFITSIGCRGELYTLIFVLSLILHIAVGVQLLKTKFSVFGKVLLLFVGGIAIASALKTSQAYFLSGVAIFLTETYLAYTFYKYLPTYYE